MNDVDRWVNLEGPEPPGIRELLDAACAVPELPPAEADRMKRAVHAALVEQDRRSSRRRRWRWALGGSLAGAGATAAVGALALWLTAPESPVLGREVTPDAVRAPRVLSAPPPATAAPVMTEETPKPPAPRVRRPRLR